MLDRATRIVIKVGSSLLINEQGTINAFWLASLAGDIAALKTQNKDVVVVTSGAIAMGRGVLGFGARALTLEEKQAAAACGQIPLMQAWQSALATHQLSPALLLVTADDSTNRRRYLNARNTLDTLLAQQTIIPIVNENDTVATAEIRFGDNDRLAARVAQMISADALVLLSDVDGLYTDNPRNDSKATLIEEVQEISADIEAMAGGAGSAVGSGGMATKIEAAKIATQAGCHMFIVQGQIDQPLAQWTKTKRATHFVAKGTPMSARKHWIAGSIHPAGELTIDEGAASALAKGNSLLPAGVVSVKGEFKRGDALLIKNTAGVTIAKGLTAYNSHDAQKIIGRKTQEIEALLGFKGRTALVHRDDMVLE